MGIGLLARCCKSMACTLYILHNFQLRNYIYLEKSPFAKKNVVCINSKFSADALIKLSKRMINFFL